ncbi:catalase [Bradyrhizobium sp. CCBAU 53415]|uniref:catalase n=1 Tax=Bradyrhizobium sp. CCBAU 53415 TaxID=1325119 RepID=UPI002304D63B|nr:catalase [Bradyrhizobium sp. CCBAU 53415]
MSRASGWSRASELRDSSQDRTRHVRFGKDFSAHPAPQTNLSLESKGFVLPEFPSGAATPISVVDALRAVAGLPPRARASFCRGQCVRGTYAPSDQAKEITRSRSFTMPSRVLARFSADVVSPNSVDTDGRSLRGFSFRLGSGHQRSEIFTQSAPVHFARTLDQMLAFLQTRMPGTDGKPDTAQVEAFSAVNPETLRQASYLAANPPPASLACTTYWGVHAFPATNAGGETRFIKFKIAPVGEERRPSQDTATAKSIGLLRDLESRIAARDVRFSVMALLDRPGDPVMDVTIRWPDEDGREAVRLGTIVITGTESNEACDASMFNPGNLAEGIGHPPDEMFAARRAVYAISQTGRR